MSKITNYVTVDENVHEVLFSIVYDDVSYDWLVLFSNLSFGGIPNITVFDQRGNSYKSDDLASEKDETVLYKRTIGKGFEREVNIRISKQPGGQKSIAFTYKPRIEKGS